MKSDASGFILEAILSQGGDDKLHPIAFYSRKFSTTKINYEIHKELLIIINLFQEWHHLLKGTFHVVFYILIAIIFNILCLLVSWITAKPIGICHCLILNSSLGIDPKNNKGYQMHYLGNHTFHQRQEIRCMTNNRQHSWNQSNSAFLQQLCQF